MRRFARWWLTLGLVLVLLAWLLAHYGAPFWQGGGLHPDITFNLDGKVWRLDGWESAYGLPGWLGAAVALFAVAVVGLVLLQQLLRTLSAHIQPAGGASGPGHLKWIQAAVGQTIQMIPVEEVLFFVSDEKYTRVQTAKVEALIRKPIKELADTLDPALFWRIHRSTLVNARAIDGITRDFRGRQLVGVKGSGEKLEVSRSYAHLFKGM